MTDEKDRTRKPWLAGLLQFILPGLGNLYSGRPQRAVMVFLLLRVLSFGVLLIILFLSGLLSLVLFLLFGLSLTVLVIVDGVRCAKAAGPQYRLRSYNRWYVYLLIVLGIALFDGFFFQEFTRSHVFQAMQPSTPSMSPALLPGDHFIANKTAYVFAEPKRGDIVVFNPPAFPIATVKRVIGLPGETVSIRDRAVFINDQKLEEPYVRFSGPPTLNTSPGDSIAATAIPPESYYVLGDARDNSNDSRFFGPISRVALDGKVTTIFYSADPETGKVRWERIGLVPK